MPTWPNFGPATVSSVPQRGVRRAAVRNDRDEGERVGVVWGGRQVADLRLLDRSQPGHDIARHGDVAAATGDLRVGVDGLKKTRIGHTIEMAIPSKCTHQSASGTTQSVLRGAREGGTWSSKPRETWPKVMSKLPRLDPGTADEVVVSDGAARLVAVGAHQRDRGVVTERLDTPRVDEVVFDEFEAVGGGFMP